MDKAEYLKKYQELTLKINELQGKRTALRNSYAIEALEKNGYHIGDRIKDCHGFEYEITKAEPVGSSLWLSGKKIKKDGTPSERETNIYSIINLKLL